MSDMFQPYPKVSTDWAWRGTEAVILENEHLRCTVVPAWGGRIVEFVGKPHGRDLMYHHPRIRPTPPVFGAPADDQWTGGMDEILPTGHASTVDGQTLPDLGEFWSVPWTAETSAGSEAVGVTLRAEGVITPLVATRHLELRHSEPFIRARHDVVNVGFLDVPLMWGIHPGLAIRPGGRIQVPGTRGVFWEGDASVAIPRGTRFDWPLLPTSNGFRDLSTARTVDAPSWELVFVDDLTDGWLAVTDPQTATGFALSFDPEVFRCVWVWGVYGGWRGLYTVAVEPWTAYPPRLEDVISSGRARVLEPGEHLQTDLLYHALRGVGLIDRIDRNGMVHHHSGADR